MFDGSTQCNFPMLVIFCWTWNFMKSYCGSFFVSEMRFSDVFTKKFNSDQQKYYKCVRKFMDIHQKLLFVGKLFVSIDVCHKFSLYLINGPLLHTACFSSSLTAGIYLLKVNTRTRCEICSKLVTLMASFWCLYC